MADALEQRDAPTTAPGATAELRLLGAFALIAADGSAVAVAAPRAQSLLAYLALHADQQPSRRHVAFLMWPDSTEAQARNSLRQLLHQVRAAWPDADRFVAADATTVSLRPDTGLRLDVQAYESALLAAAALDDGADPLAERAALERAAGLYRGDLLPASYDDWVTAERERLALRHERLLDRLVGLLERVGDYRAAIEWGQHRLRLDPLDERVYRWLMRLHALNHDRAGALRVYQACVAVLDRELGVEPERSTRELAARIERQESPVGGAVPEPEVEATRERALAAVVSPFIGRRDAWAQVMTSWRRMVRDGAGLVVIRGEAGIGKSRLAAELCEWARQQGIASASSRAWAAEGRLAYAPVADWLRSAALTPVLPGLDVGTLSEISRLLPELLAQRPDLPRPSPRIEDWQRQSLFQALATAILGAEQPIVLVLDDLQWCDADTLEWLHYLLRTGHDARVLVVGTMRPEEVGRAHPAAVLVAALREAHQVAEIDLGPLDAGETGKLAASVAGRALRPGAARHLYAETEGNPLFVVETVRALEERVKAGTSSADPAALPPNVHAVIAARLEQLTGAARDLASVAATAGRAFELSVVQVAADVDEATTVGAIEELLERRLVREQGGGTYDFSHDKIREVAYATMSEPRRRLLHRRVAEALQRAHRETLDDVAAQIAAHYAYAGITDRAAAFYRRAAEVAQRVGANHDAIALSRQGLDQLEAMEPGPDRDDLELGLQAGLGASLVATDGYGGADVGDVLERCRKLCRRLGRPVSPPILRALAIRVLAKVRIADCYDIGLELLEGAERDDDSILRVEAHYVLAMALQLGGELMGARTELEASLASYDRRWSAVHIGLYTQDPAVVCLIRLAVDLWLLGDADGAARRRDESLALAAELGHPFSHGYALTWDAVLECLRGDAARAHVAADAAIALSREHRLPFWASYATTVRGWAIAEEGEIAHGVAEIRRGMAEFAAIGSMAFRTFQLGLLAEQLGRGGAVDEGLATIDEALALCASSGERWIEADLHRRRGDLLRQASDLAGAADAYRQAVAVSRAQGAHALVARATARLEDLAGRQAS